VTFRRIIVRGALCACAAWFSFAGAALPARAFVPVVENDPSAATTAIELWFRAPADGYGKTPVPGIARLAIAAVAASAAPHGTSLAQFVNQIGGTFSISVYPDISSVSASVPSTQAQAVLKAMTGAFFNPQITAEGLKAALQDSDIAAADAAFNPDMVLQDALFTRMFASGPAHYPAIPVVSDAYSSIPAQDVKSFAGRAFARTAAVVSIAGNVAPDLMRDAGPAEDSIAQPPIDSVLSSAPVDQTVTAHVSGVGFAWAGAPISDRRTATAMDFIADYLFDPERGVVSTTLQKADPKTYVTGQFITLHDPGVLFAAVTGMDAKSARAAVMSAVASMEQPLDPKTFEAARNAFLYRLYAQTQTPLARADNFGWYAAEGDAGYAPGGPTGTYVDQVRSLDPGFVASVVRKYLQNPNVVAAIAAPETGTGAI
jgi:predicted Zn-dependent peptidase